MALYSVQTYGAIDLSNTPNPTEIDYNLHIGSLQFNLGAGTRLFWDSNFNLNNNSSDGEAAAAIVPTIAIQAYWPISPYLVFSTGTEIGYEYYFVGEGDGRDGLTIGGIDENATSRIDFDLSLSNDAIITFSNTFSANIASASFQTENQQRQNQPFREFNNTHSLRYAQRLTTNTRTSFGYTFSNTFTRDVGTGTTSNNTAAINTLDNQEHSFFAELGKQLNDSLTISLQGNFSSTIYAEDFRNDSRQYQLGPRVTYISIAGMSTSVYLGVNRLEFDNTNSPVTQENESTNLTFESSVRFTTGNFLTHTFSFNYLQEPSQGTTANPGIPGETIPANFQEETNFNYRLNYRLSERLNVSLFYELRHIKESDGGNQYSEETISAGLPFQLNTRITISTNYTYSKTFGSEFDEFNYDRHLVDITFRFDF